MREIKFRTWDKEFEEWIENPEKYLIEDINYFNECHWLQYTGLKDKKGNDIYEGDIIESEGFLRPNITEVYFDEEWAGFYGKLIYKSSFITVKAESMIQGEVIGNIYENKELLKEK